MSSEYRGRIAPSPTGLLHLGHAQTFWIAHQRARSRQGTLVLRDEDIDSSRCRPEFVQAYLEDLSWFGIDWNEGPFHQSQRLAHYREAFERLRAAGLVYPCRCTRKDIQRSAPQAGEDELIYPGTCRDSTVVEDCNWRLRVPNGQRITIQDGFFGKRAYYAGEAFGDFVVWTKEDGPSYQLAVVVDDALMGMTEVVRGADLLLSTARQLLLYRALGWQPPAFFHCPLVNDDQGLRLAKRSDALSLRALREQGQTPEQIRAGLEGLEILLEQFG